MLGSQDIQGVTQVNVFIIECEGIRRAKDLHHVERSAKNNNENQSLPSIDVSHEYTDGSRGEDESQAEEQEDQGIIVIEPMKASVVCGRYQSKPGRGAEHDKTDPCKLDPNR